MPAPDDAALNRSVIVTSLLTSVPPALQPITTSRSGSARPRAISASTPRSTSGAMLVEVAVDDVADERGAVADAAAVVRPQHDVALAGQHRHVVQRRARRRCRTCRTPSGRRAAARPADSAVPGLIVGRIEEHALDRRAVGALPLRPSPAAASRSRARARRTGCVTRVGAPAAAPIGSVHTSPNRVGSSSWNTILSGAPAPIAPARRDVVRAVGQLLRAARGDVDPEELAVHAHVDDGDDRLAVRRPRPPDRTCS